MKKKENKTKALGAIVLALIVGISIILFSNQESGSPKKGVPRLLTFDLPISKNWSEKIDIGVGTSMDASWAVKRDDVPYVVEYTTLQGNFEETFPARKSRGPHWTPQYTNIYATGARFRIPRESSIKEAEMTVTISKPPL